MNNIKSNLKLCWKIFAERFFSSKLAAIFIILFFLQHIFLSPLKQYAAAVRYSVSPYVFPFLISDIYFQIVLIAAVLYFFSNVPFMQYGEMYHLIRMGRIKWVIGQIGYLFLSSFGITVLTIAESILILFPNIKMTAEWGKVLYTVSLTDAGDPYHILFGISYEYINKYHPLQAMAVSILICTLLIFFIGLLMFTVSLYLTRTAALGISSLFMALPIISKNIGVNQQLIFSYFSPVSWLQVTLLGGRKYGYRILPDLPYVLLMLALIIFILCIVIIWKIKSIEFDWNHED